MFFFFHFIKWINNLIKYCSIPKAKHLLKNSTIINYYYWIRASAKCHKCECKCDDLHSLTLTVVPNVHSSGNMCLNRYVIFCTNEHFHQVVSDQWSDSVAINDLIPLVNICVKHLCYFVENVKYICIYYFMTTVWGRPPHGSYNQVFMYFVYII